MAAITGCWKLAHNDVGHRRDQLPDGFLVVGAVCDRELRVAREVLVGVVRLALVGGHQRVYDRGRGEWAHGGHDSPPAWWIAAMTRARSGTWARVCGTLMGWS